MVALSLYYTLTGNPSLGLEYAEKCFNSAEKIKDFETYGTKRSPALYCILVYK